MRQFLVRFSESEASNHAPSLADFTTTTPELKFSVHTPDSGCAREGFLRHPLPGRAAGWQTGNSDPGYGSTSKMIAESALCLARDVQGEGGTWTPGALMGPALRKCLKERAGLTFIAR
jgi:hypothetical protein